MNAGVYIFTASVLNAIPASRPFSIETDLLPALVRDGQAWGWPVAERVMDIGTPERYAQAQDRLRSGPAKGDRK
jgi:NDP-sugar pyrophosphorylase family protein